LLVIDLIDQAISLKEEASWKIYGALKFNVFCIFNVICIQKMLKLTGEQKINCSIKAIKKKLLKTGVLVTHELHAYFF
jgi:hypothetical protein